MRNLSGETFPLRIGETSITAYRGDRGKTAFDYSQVGHLPLTGGNMTGILYADAAPLGLDVLYTAQIGSHLYVGGNIELGHASDTSLIRVSAGLVSIEGQNILTAATGAAIAQTFYIGTTQVAINRASGALTLAGLTLTTPNIGVATGTSLTNSGALTLASTGVGVNINTHTDATDDFTVNSTMLVVEGDTGNVGIGTVNPISVLHIKASVPGIIGNDYAGQLNIQSPTDNINTAVVITGYKSDVNGDPDVQLWYLGSSSSSNQNINFLNRLNGNLTLGTNDITRLTIAAGGAMNFYSNALTNINIDSGAIDGTPIGAGTPSTGAFTTLSATGNVSFDGGTFVFNEAGADKDFRVEAVGAVNALFVQGSDGRIGAGTSVPGLHTGTSGSNAKYFSLGGGTAATFELFRAANVDTQAVGRLQFINTENADGSNDDADGKSIAYISGHITTSDNNAGNDSGGFIKIATKPEGRGLIERMRIDSGGNTLFYSTESGKTDWRFTINLQDADNPQLYMYDEGASYQDLQIGGTTSTFTRINDKLRCLQTIYVAERAAAAGDIAGLAQMWVKSDAPNELWFTNDVGTDYLVVGKDYGSCYGNEIAWTQTNAALNTWYDISDADMVTGVLKGITHDGNGKLTVPIAGDYAVDYSGAFQADATNVHIQIAISIDGTESANGMNHFNTFGTNKQQAASGTAILTLTAGQTVNISIRTTDAGTPDLTIDHLMLRVLRVGG